MKRLSLLAALALLLALCVLATAGPALAGNPFGGNPPGSQWGGHEINGKFYFVSDNGADVYTFQCVASDPRVSGVIVVTVEEWWDTPDGLGHASGYYDLTNEGGSWHCPYWQAVYSAGITVDKPTQQLVLQTDAFGSDGYDGLVFRSSSHTAAGKSPFIIKGWIL